MPDKISLTNVTKTYDTTSGQTVHAVLDVSLEIEPGAFLAVVGPSGCGKSTLLKLIAGLEAPNAGVIDLGREHPARNVGFVFQRSGVFPWRTVHENLTYSAQTRGDTPTARAAQAVELCQLVGLDPPVFLSKYPRELSGGEERRVAIGMALSTGASLLLFDEATSQLDYVSKLRLQRMIHQLWSHRRPTVVYVTHDIEESLILGSQVAVMRQGRVVDLLTVPFASPRLDGVVTTEAYLALKQRILRNLEA